MLDHDVLFGITLPNASASLSATCLWVSLRLVGVGAVGVAACHLPTTKMGCPNDTGCESSPSASASTPCHSMIYLFDNLSDDLTRIADDDEIAWCLMLHHYTQPIHGEFDENSFLWKDIAPWSTKWQSLSAPARIAFLQKVKAPTSPNRFTEISSNPEAINTSVRQELLTAGFIELRCPRGRHTERMFVPDAVIPFSNRIRALHQFGLTAIDNTLGLKSYVNRFFIKSLLMARFREVMTVDGRDVELGTSS